MTVAGHSGPLPFSAEAIESIARFTEGIPRNINNFCFNVLSLGCALRHKVIHPMLVEEVIRDLDINQHVTEIPDLAASEGDAIRMAESYETPWTNGGSCRDPLTPAEAKAYMRQLAVQLKDWKRN